jgi:hypothetical protein
LALYNTIRQVNEINKSDSNWLPFYLKLQNNNN